MSPRTAWRWCAAAGIAAFTCSWLFGRIPELVACGPTGGLGPIIAFELARTPAEIAALFGEEPCRSALAAAQKTGLLLDGLGFIPSYTAFLTLGAAAVARGPAKWMLVAAFATAGLSDEIEGYILGQILNALPGDQASIDALFWAVRLKFALLAIGTFGIGLSLLGASRVAAIAPAVAIGAGAAFALHGLLAPLPARMMAGLTLAWVLLLLTAFIASLWPSAFAPSPVPAAPPQAPA